VEVYGFEPVEGIVLAPWEAREALALAPWERARLRVGLGRDLALVESRPDSLAFTVSQATYEVGRAALGEALGRVGERVIYLGPSGELGFVEVRSRGYYKLVPVPRAPPTLEINGIHMHRIRGTDPGRDTRAKVRAARVGRGSRVLDTCMGLGYTAVYSALRGAEHVVTVEVDENVVLLARYNPWSRPLARPPIDVVLGDATRVVWELEEGYFTRIIHDPPRIGPSTGDLYSTEFYARLYDLLAPGGVLFHYTGEPGKKWGARFPGRVAGRLARVGFTVLGFDGEAKGVVAVKGRRAS